MCLWASVVCLNSEQISGIHVRFSAEESESKRMHVVRQASCGAGLAVTNGSPCGRAGGVAWVNPDPAKGVLLLVVRPPDLNDTPTKTGGSHCVLHGVNSSNSSCRGFSKSGIFCLPHVCCVPNCLTGQTRRLWFSSSLWSLTSVTLHPACQRPSLRFFYFHLTTFDFLVGLSQWPSDLVLHFSETFQLFFLLFFSRASLPAFVSPTLLGVSCQSSQSMCF